MWDTFCSVSENQLQFAVFPACVWNTLQIDHRSSSRRQLANSWNQPLLLDLQCPLVCLATRDERLSKMWWLIQWAVKCCGGETQTCSQPARIDQEAESVHVVQTVSAKEPVCCLFVFLFNKLQLCMLQKQEDKNVNHRNWKWLTLYRPPWRV